ncbi:nuclear transport factor 2 family protein [Sphingomonas colocasiae]|uniref:Nuclear transport factor 2 family protein n=1 Tax=Sphingomonas colocasiae TaxID=1848973 RepID=A0ABS7PIQ5_9SPHN|nr:nuclear transport factor 2 family protein [Sphingomonas colocasiae]MBY8821187.1 nuclear transport factor 2 family protein [Sphingomonas colocasiae]
MAPADAKAFAQDWIEAFNAHDLERILRHYAPDVELVSPIYRSFTDRRADTVYGIAALRDYFGAALRRYPQLRFTLLDVATGVYSLCIRYHTNLGDRIAIECLEHGIDGGIVRATCHYAEG